MGNVHRTKLGYYNRTKQMGKIGLEIQQDNVNNIYIDLYTTAYHSFVDEHSVWQKRIIYISALDGHIIEKS
jgi:hypothetical protein